MTAGAHHPGHFSPLKLSIMPTVYKKKPEEFGAIQWTGDNFEDVKCFTASRAELQGNKVIIPDGNCHITALVGDWIVLNLNTEEIYSEQDKIFPSKYEISHEIKIGV